MAGIEIGFELVAGQSALHRREAGGGEGNVGEGGGGVSVGVGGCGGKAERFHSLMGPLSTGFMPVEA